MSNSTELGLSLTAACISSALGYYIICKYADLATELRHPSNWNNNLEREKSASRVKKNSKIFFTGKLRIIKILFMAIVYGAIEIAAASFLSVASLVPFRFLYFFYACCFRLCSHDKQSGEDMTLMTLIFFIFILVVFAVVSSPKTEAIINRNTLLDDFDGKTIGYWLPVSIWLIICFIISKDDDASNKFAKYLGFGVCCTHFTYKDIQSILKAIMAGSVGGQALALIRIVSLAINFLTLSNNEEENDIELNTVRPFIVLGFTILLSFLHLYLIHRGLSDLSLINVSLFMPVYVSCFALSSLFCSLLYLRELYEMERQTLFTYTVCLLSLFLLTFLLGIFSVSPAVSNTEDLETGRQTANSIYEDAILDERPNDKNKPTLWNISLDGLHRGMNSLSLSRKQLVLGSDTTDYTHGNSKYFNTDASKLDFNYPTSEHSMLTKKGLPNPYISSNASNKQVSYWEDSGSKPGVWNIRGKNYLKDRVKVPSLVSRMKLINVDWIYLPRNKVECISKLKDGFIQKYHVTHKSRPFILVINFIVPSLGNSVMYFVPRPGVVDTAFEAQLRRFIENDNDSYRNDRIKLIPGVERGNYIVRKFVGSTPAIIGRKLATKYYSGDNWYEISIDVGSSKIGKSIMGSVKGFATTLVLNLAFLIEGKTEEELPEKMIGGVYINYPLMKPYGEYNLSPECLS